MGFFYLIGLIESFQYISTDFPYLLQFSRKKVSNWLNSVILRHFVGTGEFLFFIGF